MRATVTTSPGPMAFRSLNSSRRSARSPVTFSRQMADSLLRVVVQLRGELLPQVHVAGTRRADGSRRRCLERFRRSQTPLGSFPS